MDVGMAPGQDFVTSSEAAVRDADVILVMIGPQWAQGSPDNPRYGEIATAFRLDRPVIPILVDQTRMPSRSELERIGLPQLARINAATLSLASWRRDVERLIVAIDAATSLPRPIPVTEAEYAEGEVSARVKYVKEQDRRSTARSRVVAVVSLLAALISLAIAFAAIYVLQTGR